MRGPLRDRLYARLTPCPDAGCTCLLWTGCTRDGYGRIWDDGQTLSVHRVAWELASGPIPDGLVIDHVRNRGCRHLNCVNVAHLEPVTPQINTLRGDTFQARHAATTHCPRGHPYDDVNTYAWGGSRHCRACRRIRQNARRPAA